MSTTPEQFRAELAQLETPAIESCIAQSAQRSSTGTMAGICYNARSLDHLSQAARIRIAQDVLAERLAGVEQLLRSVFE